jgi:tripartite-type tricarboxylate transporter receptor subunit TctC
VVAYRQGSEHKGRVTPAGGRDEIMPPTISAFSPPALILEGTMKLPHRRQFLHLAAGAAALPVVSRIAQAQAYPTRPVRLLVGAAPGGSLDILARLMGQWLSDKLGRQFIVENRTGAGVNVATEAVVRAAPDGYTLLMVSTPNATNATLYEKLNFVFLRDILPVASMVSVPLVMMVHPSFPARSVSEFIAYAKAHPGKINFGSSGNGSTLHVTAEMFKMMAGVSMAHVAYRGSAPMLTDLLGGQIQVAFADMPPSVEHIRNGTLRALAVTTKERSSSLPGIPPIGDFLLGFEASAWQGIGAPKNTPAVIIERLNKEDQCRPRQPRDQSAAWRSRALGALWLAGRLWQAHSRRNREMGQGDPGGQHQGRVSPRYSIFVIAGVRPRCRWAKVTRRARDAMVSLLPTNSWRAA